MSLRCIDGCLDDRRLRAEIGEARAVDGVVVWGDDPALCRRHVIGETTRGIHGRTGQEAEHGSRSRLHDFPHIGAAKAVDRRVAPVVDDPRQRRDIVLIGKLRGHTGRTREIRMCGYERARGVRYLRARLRRTLRRAKQRQSNNCRYLFHCRTPIVCDETCSTSESTQLFSNSALVGA